MASFSIHPAARTGPLHLTVSDLGRSIAFYRDVLGFTLLREEVPHAWLGAADKNPLLILSEQPGARPKPRRSSGLYHFAVLHPDRASLASGLRRLADTGYPLGGASDHLVSEALYLSDPDGHGIELYRDRPREEWPYRDGQLLMDTLPLDLQDLVREASPGWKGLPAGTTIGHVHLHVGHLQEAVRFYGEILGLDLITRYGGAAAFMSAGGYHHHLGLNTWAGVGAPPPPPDSASLRYFTILLPSEAEVDRLREHANRQGVELSDRGDSFILQDPSWNRISVLAESNTSTLFPPPPE